MNIGGKKNSNPYFTLRALPDIGRLMDYDMSEKKNPPYGLIGFTASPIKRR